MEASVTKPKSSGIPSVFPKDNHAIVPQAPPPKNVQMDSLDKDTYDGLLGLPSGSQFCFKCERCGEDMPMDNQKVPEAWLKLQQAGRKIQIICKTCLVKAKVRAKKKRSKKVQSGDKADGPTDKVHSDSEVKQETEASSVSQTGPNLPPETEWIKSEPEIKEEPGMEQISQNVAQTSDDRPYQADDSGLDCKIKHEAEVGNVSQGVESLHNELCFQMDNAELEIKQDVEATSVFSKEEVPVMAPSERVYDSDSDQDNDAADIMGTELQDTVMESIPVKICEDIVSEEMVNHNDTTTNSVSEEVASVETAHQPDKTIPVQTHKTRKARKKKRHHAKSSGSKVGQKPQKTTIPIEIHERVVSAVNQQDATVPIEGCEESESMGEGFVSVEMAHAQDAATDPLEIREEVVSVGEGVMSVERAHPHHMTIPIETSKTAMGCPWLTPSSDHTHMGVHTRFPFICSKCNRYFATKTELIIHMNADHIPENVSSERIKFGFMRDHGGYLKYSGSHVSGPRITGYKQKSRPSPKTLLSPVPDEYVSYCMLCYKQFQTDQELRQHQRKNHFIQCVICKASFHTWFDFLWHEYQHLTINPQSATAKKLLNCKEKPKIAKGKGFGCEICGTTYPNAFGWKMHLMHHKTCSSTMEEMPLEHDPVFEWSLLADSGYLQPNPLACHDNDGRLIGSMRYCYDVENNWTVLSATALYVCHWCPAQFTTRSDLVSHSEEHPVTTPDDGDNNFDANESNVLLPPDEKDDLLDLDWSSDTDTDGEQLPVTTITAPVSSAKPTRDKLLSSHIQLPPPDETEVVKSIQTPLGVLAISITKQRTQGGAKLKPGLVRYIMNSAMTDPLHEPKGRSSSTTANSSTKPQSLTESVSLSASTSDPSISKLTPPASCTSSSLIKDSQCVSIATDSERREVRDTPQSVPVDVKMMDQDSHIPEIGSQQEGNIEPLPAKVFYKCLNCPREFHSREQRRRHIDMVHTRVSCMCNICNMGPFYCVTRLNFHHLVFHNENRNLFMCEVCGCLIKGNVKKAIENEKYGLKNEYICSVCNDIREDEEAKTLKEAQDFHDSLVEDMKNKQVDVISTEESSQDDSKQVEPEHDVSIATEESSQDVSKQVEPEHYSNLETEESSQDESKQVEPEQHLSLTTEKSSQDVLKQIEVEHDSSIPTQESSQDVSKQGDPEHNSNMATEESSQDISKQVESEHDLNKATEESSQVVLMQFEMENEESSKYVLLQDKTGQDSSIAANESSQDFLKQVEVENDPSILGDEGIQYVLLEDETKQGNLEDTSLEVFESLRRDEDTLTQEPGIDSDHVPEKEAITLFIGPEEEDPEVLENINTESVSDLAEDKSEICDHCSRTFPDLATLEGHMGQCGNEALLCPLCMDAFFDKASLRLHTSVCTAPQESKKGQKRTLMEIVCSSLKKPVTKEVTPNMIHQLKQLSAVPKGKLLRAVKMTGACDKKERKSTQEQKERKAAHQNIHLGKPVPKPRVQYVQRKIPKAVLDANLNKTGGQSVVHNVPSKVLTDHPNKPVGQSILHPAKLPTVSTVPTVQQSALYTVPSKDLTPVSVAHWNNTAGQPEQHSGPSKILIPVSVADAYKPTRQSMQCNVPAKVPVPVSLISLLMRPPQEVSKATVTAKTPNPAAKNSNPAAKNSNPAAKNSNPAAKKKSLVKFVEPTKLKLPHHQESRKISPHTLVPRKDLLQDGKVQESQYLTPVKDENVQKCQYLTPVKTMLEHMRDDYIPPAITPIPEPQSVALPQPHMLPHTHNPIGVPPIAIVPHDSKLGGAPTELTPQGGWSGDRCDIDKESKDELHHAMAVRPIEIKPIDDDNDDKACASDTISSSGYKRPANTEPEGVRDHKKLKDSAASLPLVPSVMTECPFCRVKVALNTINDHLTSHLMVGSYSCNHCGTPFKSCDDMKASQMVGKTFLWCKLCLHPASGLCHT